LTALNKPGTVEHFNAAANLIGINKEIPFVDKTRPPEKEKVSSKRKV